ncbi:MAG: tetratricopeptide repeat protein [Flavobacteriaceae bacterium]|nr:tetratricopeptide repeat protein [Flavobacteriaceae bacterium]MBT6601078.1 tetratricopeptide repeat protein [Nitrospina sp.]
MNFINPTTDSYIFLGRIKALVLICFCGVVIFFSTVHSPFLYDDAHAIEDNPYIKDISKFQQMVGVQNIFNRSILLFTFSVNHEIGELDVFGYHLINILLHLCVVIVLYFLIQNLLIIEEPKLIPTFHKLPLVVALIHLFHPINVESVTYLSSRSSVLVTLFYLLSFYLFIKFINFKGEEGNKWKNFHYPLVALLLFCLGLGTKEIIVTLPIMAVLYLWVKSPQKTFNKFLPELAIILTPLILYLLYRYVHMGNLLVIRSDPYSYMTDRGLYILTQIKVLVSYYLIKIFFPINLNFEPDIRLVSGIFDWTWMASIMGGFGIAIVIFKQNSTLLKCAFFWALVTVLPTSSIIPLKQIATEHRTYLPGIGISMGIGILLLRTITLSRLLYPTLIIVLVIYSFLTMKRGLDYRSEVKIWEDTARKSPYKSMVHNNLGTAYLFKEELKEAQQSFAIASALSPSDVNPYINMGHIHARKKEWEKAKLKYDLALKLGSNRSQVFFNSGLMRLKLKQAKEAIPFLLEAIKIKNHRPLYHQELGNAFRTINEYDLALKSYRKVLSLKPTHVEAQNNIGVIFWKLKALDKAELEFKKALEIEDKSMIHKNLANLYIAKKQFKDAIPHLKIVISRNPSDSRSRNLLHIVKIIKNTPVE